MNKKDLNVSRETVKILEENIGSKVSDISRNNIFADIYLRLLETKAKINKWYYIKSEIVCIAKEIIREIIGNLLHGRILLPMTYLMRV